MLNRPAARSLPRSLYRSSDTVVLPAELAARGWTAGALRAQLAARRWQRIGRAIALHNSALRRDEARRAALLNCGPRAVLTSFSAAEALGMQGWERDPTHVLVPGGTKVRRVAQLPVRIHYSAHWESVATNGAGVHELAPALVLAASSFPKTRPACGILAAGVQQRLVTPAELCTAIASASRTRHHAALVLAMYDIAQGSEALSEIDFVRLCRRFALPEPERQVIRPDRWGRRRYLDAEWNRRDGRRVVAEVDGALHLQARTWYADQIRQNEVAIHSDIVLRFPTVVVRNEQELVADQLGRALLC